MRDWSDTRARLAEMTDELKLASQWIGNCVDPIKVGFEKRTTVRRTLLAAPTDIADLLAENAALRAELAVQADLSLLDLVARRLCAQAEAAEAEGETEWWSLSTDDVAELIASALTPRFAALREALDRVNELCNWPDGPLTGDPLPDSWVVSIDRIRRAAAVVPPVPEQQQP